MTAEQNQQAPRQIVLNEEHIKNLEGYISEMPTKLGLPLINFLNHLAQEQANETSSRESVTDNANSVQSSEEI
jgi:hypothetical protein